MKQTDEKSPQSWRKLFPLTEKSQAIRDLVKAAAGYARDSWFIPIVAPPADRLELRSFFIRVAEERGGSEFIDVIGERFPNRHELEDCDNFSLLLLKAEGIPEYAQWEIIENRLCFPVVMLALAHHPGSGDTPVRAAWIKAFQEACAPEPLVWPAWNERAEDHADIVIRIRERLSLPKNGGIPEFDRSALDYLMSKPFQGTGQAEREIKHALRRYFLGRQRGPLSARHFAVFDGLGILSSHKSVPPLSVAR